MKKDNGSQTIAVNAAKRRSLPLSHKKYTHQKQNVHDDNNAAANKSPFLPNGAKNKIGICIKIDVGYHRTGLSPTSTQQIDEILTVINASSTLSFKGFLTHAGHTYTCRTKEEILSIHHTSREIMTGLKAKYISRYPSLIISIGDTPSCSVADDFSGIDEIRPGNFVFYDLTPINLI